MSRTMLRPALLAIALLTVIGALPPAPAHAAASLAVQQEQPAPADQAQKSFLFSDGFDASGDLSLWSGETVLTVEQGTGFQGSYGAHTVSTGEPAFAETRLRHPAAEVFARLRFNIVEQGENPVTLFRFRTVTGLPVLTAFVTPAGTLGYSADATGLTFESTQRVTRKTWQEIQVHIVLDRNDTTVEVWLDDMPVSDLSQQFGLENDSVGRIEIGDNSAGRSFDVYFDDVIADDARIDPSQEPNPISGTLTVRTLPALPGLRFELDGETFVSDAGGVARIAVQRWSVNLRQQIQVPSTQLGAEYKGAVATFWAWNSWISGRDHDVNAFFDLSYPIQLSFADQDNDPIDLSRIDSVTLQSSVGTLYSFTADQLKSPQLLPASRVVPSPQGRTSENFLYSVVEVNVRGSNVVNRAQQRFEVTGAPTRPISLLLFSATINVQDALFGRATGGTIRIEYPDGGTEQIALDSDHSVVLPLLPRGDYRVSVVGAGYSPPRPVSLSRDQVVDLEVVTLLDVSVIGGVVAAFALGLLIAGRPVIVTFPFRLYHRRRPAHVIREARG
jgi:hypothetical protein